MFGLAKRIRARNRCVTAGFHAASEMERLLIKERIRCDRFSQFFSLVVVHFNSVPEIALKTQELALARYLSSKLRLIDEFGYLRTGELGVLLPMTDLEGGKVVLSKILDHATKNGLSVEADVFSYHGRSIDSIVSTDENALGETDGSNSNESDGTPEEQFEDKVQAFREHWDAEIRKSEPVDDVSSVDAASQIVVKPSVEDFVSTDLVSKFVRADLETQSIIRGNQELLSLCCQPYPLWKRSLDVIGASFGLLVGSPVLVLASVAIRLNSQGPVLFKQLRCGQYGKPFMIYKLRTMSHDAEQTKHLLEDLNERDGPAFKIKNDPRVTLVGRFLRATGIDELPQLINVLRGEMAIVGPRPLPVSEERRCSTWHQRRLDTKPGITCLWQISKSRKMSFDEWMRLDLHYLKKRSFLYDVSLLLRTVKAVLLGRVGH